MKPIKFVDLRSQYLAYKAEIDAEVLKVLDSNQYIGGPQLKLLEQELQDFCVSRSTGSDTINTRAIGCSNGTDALLLALLATGVKAGDEVITTSFTFVSTVEMICLLGARPVFVDIDLSTGLIDAELIEDKITSKSKAIIPVSLFGQVADMNKINQVADKHSLVVIEDAAQSFGASYQGKPSCGLTKYACTSFYPAKGLGCYGDGGAVFTDNSASEQKLRSLLNHGQSERYEYVDIGINGRLDDIQAAILRVKLRHYKNEINKRQKLAHSYNKALEAHPTLTPLKLLPDNLSVYSQYSLYAPQGKRDEYRNILAEQGIPTAVYYPKPLHQHQVFENYLNQHKKDSKDASSSVDLPNTEEATARIFSLPVNPFLSQQDKIIKALSKLN